MGRDSTTPAETFPATHWSEIGRAGAADAECRSKALDALLRRYSSALRHHLVARLRLSPQKAEDLAQGFIADRILEHDLAKRADARRGRFRALLKTSLENYVRSHFRRASAKKRSSDKAFVNIDEYPDLAAVSDDAGRAMDVAWARGVIEEALRRMRKQCADSEDHVLWDVFEERILKPALENAPPGPYAELVRRHGFRSPTQVSSALIKARAAYAVCLRSVVAEYARSEEDVAEEIADLREILSRGREIAGETAYR